MRTLLLTLCILTLGVVNGQTIKIATYQYGGNTRVQNLMPLVTQLQYQAELDAKIVSYPTVHELITSIQKGEVDVAFINTFGYLLLETNEKEYPMKPLYHMQVDDSSTSSYLSIFVARKSSAVRSWGDVVSNASATRLSLTFPASTSGNLVPRLALSGLRIGDAEASFRTVSYARTHANALAQLLRDSADLAAMGADEFSRLSGDDRDKLSVIWTSPNIPLGPVLISNRLSNRVKKDLGRILLTVHRMDPGGFNLIRSGWSEARKADRFVKVDPALYQNFLQQFGDPKAVNNILSKFAN